jgi:hypothetical protein
MPHSQQPLANIVAATKFRLSTKKQNSLSRSVLAALEKPVTS